VYLILHGSALCFGSSPVPASIQPPVYGAHGSIATCEVQGFIQYLSRFIFLLYYCSLPLVVLSRLQSNFEETRRSKYIELCVHLVCNIIPWSFALTALSRNYINPVSGGAFCGLNMYPDTCLQTSSGVSTCLRGDGQYRDFRRANSWTKITPFGLSFVPLLFIRFMSHKCQQMKQAAFYQASVHLLALILSSVMSWWFYGINISSSMGDTITFRIYIAFISLWPSVGLFHLIAYFILRPTWTRSFPKVTTHVDTSVIDGPNDVEEVLMEGESCPIPHRTTSLFKRLSITSFGKGLLGYRKPRKRWSFTSTYQLEDMNNQSPPRPRRESCIELGQNLKSSHHQTIFDGTNPSQRWSAFILPSDIDPDELSEDDDEEGKYYSDICQ